MSQIRHLVFLSIALVGAPVVAQPSLDAVAERTRPPFDVTVRLDHEKRQGAIADAYAGHPGRALDSLLTLVARSPNASDVDYAYGWIARTAAQTCRLDESLAAYRVMRRYFHGRLDAGAGVYGNAHREWSDHLAVTRAYAALCDDGRPTVRAMQSADATARELLPLARYTNLARSDSITLGLAPRIVYDPPYPPRAEIPERPEQSLGVRLLRSWRFDPSGREWVETTPGTSAFTARWNSHDDLVRWVLAALAPEPGRVAVVWTAGGVMRTTERTVGEPDCAFYGTRDELDSLAYSTRRSVECLPRLDGAGGLTAVASFRQSVRPDTLPDVRAEAVRLVEAYGAQVPDSVGVRDRLETGYADGDTRLTAAGAYGRPVTVSVEKAHRYDVVDRQWKEAPKVTGGPRRLLSVCDYLCRSVADHYPRLSPEEHGVRLRDLVGHPVEEGLYRVRFVVNGEPSQRLLHHGPISCIDVVIGEPPPDEFATCVPGYGATFVPLPPAWED